MLYQLGLVLGPRSTLVLRQLLKGLGAVFASILLGHVFVEVHQAVWARDLGLVLPVEYVYSDFWHDEKGLELGLRMGFAAVQDYS